MGLGAGCEGYFGTLIVPAYNAGPFLRTTLREIRDWIAKRPEPWELIVVDDASVDATPRILEEFTEAHPGDAVRVIRFSTNRGKGFALRVGLSRARGRYAVFTDCDLAYPMSNVARVISSLENGADAAVACRVCPDSTYSIRPDFFSYLFTRHLMGRGFNLICRLVTLPRVLDTQAGLKGFRSEVLRPVLPALLLDGFSFDVELLRALLDRGARIDEVPVDFRYDREPTTVKFTLDALRMARDLVRVRWRSLRGRYRDRGEAPARWLVVNADDFGIAPGVNGAIRDDLLSGVVTSASILLGGPHAGAAMAWAAAHPEHDFGVHLNLTQGRPVLPPERVPSLVDGSGRFRSLRSFLVRWYLGRVRAGEIEHEWRAQIARVRAAGVRVSHLDSHEHVHLIPGIFRRCAAPLAEDMGVVLRGMHGPVTLGPLHPDVKGLALSVATRVDLRGRYRNVVGPRGSGTSLRDHADFERLKTSLNGARPGGRYELVVHPGFVDEALVASGDDYGPGREQEQALIAAQETRAWLQLAGFRLADHRKDRGAA